MWSDSPGERWWEHENKRRHGLESHFWGRMNNIWWCCGLEVSERDRLGDDSWISSLEMRANLNTVYWEGEDRRTECSFLTENNELSLHNSTGKLELPEGNPRQLWHRMKDIKTLCLLSWPKKSDGPERPGMLIGYNRNVNSWFTLVAGKGRALEEYIQNSLDLCQSHIEENSASARSL